MTFTDREIDIILAALHNHAMKHRVDAREAYDIQVQLLALVGKEMPLSFEEAQTIARQVRR
jgi:hypothetical protein